MVRSPFGADLDRLPPDGDAPEVLEREVVPTVDTTVIRYLRRVVPA